jgi:hypothetical protein
MDYGKLSAELTEDPLVRGYSGMNDAAASADLNTVYREKNKTSMTGSEVLNAIDQTEYNALADANKVLVWNLMALGTLNPFGMESDLLVGAFGGGSATITALAAARKESISRAVELGLGQIAPGDIENARM